MKEQQQGGKRGFEVYVCIAAGLCDQFKSFWRVKNQSNVAIVIATVQKRY